MQFNSLSFLMFFAITVVAFYSVPRRMYWLVLLGMSCLFCLSWNVMFLSIIAALTIINYCSGILIGREEKRGGAAKFFLIAALICDIGILFMFKYLSFFSYSVYSLLGSSNTITISSVNLIAPIGISFYTFMSISYIVDVYRCNKSPERHFGIFASYLSFFPLLAAGPIERSTHLLPQLQKRSAFNPDNITGGLRLLLLGFFKKIVIADRLALYVNSIYSDPYSQKGATLMVATYFFAFQIYCDFSGYSDIAKGCAKMLGIDVIRNFNRPYLAPSVSEFWRRWHISLSTWFRDYLYIPLGGNRVAVSRYYINLLLVFLVCGLWHGANWTFIFWGGLHGFFLVFGQFTKNLRKHFVRILHVDKFPLFLEILRIAITFHLILISWVFFRANSISDAFFILYNMFPIDLVKPGISVVMNRYEIFIALISISILGVIYLLQEYRYQYLDALFKRMNISFRWAFYYLIAIVILFFGEFGNSEFIYFQF